MRHWLMKTEPSSYSIDDLRRDKRTQWTGVRNYQARNFMRAMAVGDQVLVYHSNADPPGVAGLAKVVRTSHPDPTAVDPHDDHFDARSDPANPRWDAVDVAFVRKFRALVPLDRLKESRRLEGMMLLSGKALQLSVQPVDKRHFEAILALAA